MIQRAQLGGQFSTFAVDNDVHSLSKARLSSNPAMSFASTLKSYAA
jgi:hypothetical protein